jgi:PAS domain S-box-containing protein
MLLGVGQQGRAVQRKRHRDHPPDRPGYLADRQSASRRAGAAPGGDGLLGEHFGNLHHRRRRAHRSANPALTTITGYARAKSSAKHRSCFPPHGRATTSPAKAGTGSQSYGVWRGEIWKRRKNGEIFPAWLTITAVRNADGAVTHYIGSFDDITERKQLRGAYPLPRPSRCVDQTAESDAARRPHSAGARQIQARRGPHGGVFPRP